MAQKRPNLRSKRQQLVSLRYDFADVTADLTVKLIKLPFDFELLAAELKSVTGLAADGTNVFNTKITKAAGVVMANWNTLTGQQGALTADTFMSMVLATAKDDRRADGGDVLSVFFDEGGNTTLPAGCLVLHGYYRNPK